MKNLLNITDCNDSLFSDDEIKTNVLFLRLFETLPNSHSIFGQFDTEKCFEFLVDEYNITEYDKYVIFNTDNHRSNKNRFNKILGFKSETLSDITIVLEKELIVKLTKGFIDILYSSKIEKEKVSSLIDKLQKLKTKKQKKTNKFYMIVREYDGFGLTQFKLSKRDYDIDLCYNDDFTEIDKKINDFLIDKKRNGLILLHGLSGTGKTTYIRSLISKIPRKFIFLPLHMAEALSSPELIPFLTNQKNSILIIEDCEKLVVDRDMGNSNDSIATLLNLSDGLLGDALGIKLICTFNTNISKIDKALIRKGRMITRYEFKELLPEKAKSIAEKYKLKYDGLKSISVGDLFNQDENNNNQDNQTKIGFRTNN